MAAVADNSIRIPEVGLCLVVPTKAASSAIKLAVLRAKSADTTNYHVHPALYRCVATEATGYYRIGITRHPLDRLVSIWADKIKRHDGMTASRRFAEWGVPTGTSFDSFVRCLPSLWHRDIHTLPQSHFFAGVVDEFIRFEDFPAAWDLVRDWYPALGPLPRANGTDHGHWRDYYNAETLAIAQRIYADDFGGYSWQ